MSSEQQQLFSRPRTKFCTNVQYRTAYLVNYVYSKLFLFYSKQFVVTLLHLLSYITRFFGTYKCREVFISSFKWKELIKFKPQLEYYVGK